MCGGKKYRTIGLILYLTMMKGQGRTLLIADRFIVHFLKLEEVSIPDEATYLV
jgi:hypothetical protein